MGHVGYMAGKNTPTIHDPSALTAIHSRIQFYRLWKCWAKCEEGIEWHCTAEWFFLLVMYTKHNNIAESTVASVLIFSEYPHKLMLYIFFSFLQYSFI